MRERKRERERERERTGKKANALAFLPKWWRKANEITGKRSEKRTHITKQARNQSAYQKVVRTTTGGNNLCWQPSLCSLFSPTPSSFMSGEDWWLGKRRWRWWLNWTDDWWLSWAERPSKWHWVCVVLSSEMSHMPLLPLLLLLAIKLAPHVFHCPPQLFWGCLLAQKVKVKVKLKVNVCRGCSPN